MTRAVLMRILAAIPVLLGISVISFILIRRIPGDVVDSILGAEYADPALEAEMRRYFGIDRPAYAQFFDWFGSLFRGDLGYSYRTGRPVMDEIMDRFPATLELALSALIVSVAISVPLGVLAATRRKGVLDTSARFFSLIGLSMPNFWLGILLISLFAVQLQWLPSGGFIDFSLSWDHLRFLIMPAVTLGTSLAAVSLRMTRSSMLEVLGQDYVRTARSKGLAPQTVIGRHALRNALIPVVTVIGIQTGALLGGTVVIEQVFSWPGLGTMVITAIGNRDYALVQGSILFLAAFFVIVNLLVDIIYLYLDPRLRHGN